MRAFKRCLSAFVAMAMIFTTLMTLGVAEDGEVYSPEAIETEDAVEYSDAGPDVASAGVVSAPPEYVVVGFAALDELTEKQYWTIGTALDKLILPSELTATVLSGVDVTKETIPVSGWRSDPEYDPETLGTYVFSPELSLSDGVSLGENITPPRITVEIKALMGIMPMNVSGTTLTVTVTAGGSLSDAIDTALGGTDASSITTMVLTGGSGFSGIYIPDSHFSEKFPNISTLDLSGFAGTFSSSPFGAANNSVVTIKLPAGSGTLPSEAFWYFTKLTTIYTNTLRSGEVDLSDSTLTFKDYTFHGCTSITTVKLKPNATFQQDMFSGCVALTTVYTNVKTPDLVDLSGCTNIISFDSAFMGCESITAVKLTSGAILPRAIFAYCTKLDTVYTISEMSGLVDLSDDISFSTGLEFKGCPSITKVKLQPGVALLNQTFSECEALTTVYTDTETPGLVDLSGCIITNGYSSIEGCTSVTAIKLPSGASVPSYAFGGLTSLKVIALPDTPLSSVASDAFSDGNTGQMLLVDDSVKSGYVLPANLPTGTSFPTISGTTSLQAGDTLSFSVSPDVSAATAVAYQWKKDGAAVSGATGRTYSKANVIVTDGGSYTCEVSLRGTTTYTTDAITVTVITPLSGTPVISGTVQIGEELTANITGLNTTTGLTYQWKSNGQNIGGATDTKYTVQGSDVGKKITVTVTASGGYSGSATSAATAVVPYTINLVPSGNVVGDAVSFGTSGTMTTYAVANDPVTINYMLNRGDIVNKIEFGNGISDATASSGTGFVTGTLAYTVNPSNAVSGVINITAIFIHEDEISSENVDILAPVTGQNPQTPTLSTSHYTGTVTWDPSHTPFEGSTEYTVTIELEATGDASFASGFTPTVNGNPATTVTVSQDGSTATFSYKFPPTTAKSVGGITVTADPQLTYTEGDTLDLSALKVTVSYNDGTDPDILQYGDPKLAGATYSINGSPVTSGMTTLAFATHDGYPVTISYGGKPANTEGNLKVHKPPTVNISVGELTLNSATINYAVIIGKEYTTATLQKFSGIVWSDVLNASSPYTVSELASNTIYQYRVVATDTSAGNRKYMFPVSFKTLAQNPSGVNVAGTITDQSPNPSMVVTLRRGNRVIASATVIYIGNNKYSYSFVNIPKGYYDLVSNNGSYEVTEALNVTGIDISDRDITMSADKEQSELKIVSEDIPIAVEGLENLYKNSNLITKEDEKVLAANGTLEFDLIVEMKKSPSDASKIISAASGKEIGRYLDFSVFKSRYAADGTFLGGERQPDLKGSFIDIYYYLPDDLIGKSNLTVYRVHNDSAGQLNSRKDDSVEYGIFYDDGGILAEIHVNKFSTYAIAYNANTSSSSSSGGGGGSSVTNAGTFWIEVPEAKTMAKDALNKQLDYARSSRAAITGIRKNSLLALAESGLRYRHDTLADGAVQVRVYIDDPSKAKKDILVSGSVNGESIDNIKAKFVKKFQNKLAVISMDQQGGFGIKVQIAAKVNLSGMNTKNLYFYSYDKNTNKYIRIETEYRIDENGYLHFATVLGGYIIVSDGPLSKHGTEQTSGLAGTSTYNMDNPETGGDSPSETWITGNLSSLPIGNDNPDIGEDSPVDMLITDNILPLTIENYSPTSGGKQEVMLSASISRNEFRALKRGGYFNMKIAVVAMALLFAGILVGVGIPRLRNFRRYNGR